MKNKVMKTTLLAVTILLWVLAGCAAVEITSLAGLSENRNDPSANPNDPNNPNAPNINNPSPSGPVPIPPEPIIAGVAYKPFASGHGNKFSLGDFDSPYLVRLDDYTNFVASNSSILLNDAPHEITKTSYQGNTYVGIAGFDFNDYSTFTGNNNALTIKVSLSTTNGSAITNGAVASGLMVTAPTRIYTWQDLQGMKHDLAGEYELRSDITFPAKGSEGLAMEGFEPVGDDSDHFTGSFDGNERSIVNLSIDRPGRDGIGIWGYVNGADSVIEDFVVDHAGIRGDDNVGSVVGQLNAGIVTNVGMMSSGDMPVSGNEDVGGLVGWNSGSRVYGYATGAVSGRDLVGGLVGQNRGGGVVDGYTTGAVSGGTGVGGLVGESSGNGRVHGYATGDITGTGVRVGGLVGLNDMMATATGYATGEVTGDRQVGGLVGRNNGGTLNGYATGEVTGNSDAGGLVGMNSGTVHGYWDEASTRQNNSAGGEGISAITNVVFAPPNTYEDSGNGNAAVFDNGDFLRLFDLPRANNVTWPDLKVAP